MKDFRPFVAAFVALMLVIPAISAKLATDVQHGDTKYSSSAARVSQAPLQEETGAAVQVFKVLVVATGKVETVPVDDYICGVVAAEISSSSAPEALKAQAAAAFTYACYQRAYNTSHPAAAAAISGADITDDYRHNDAYISKQQLQAKWGSSFTGRWDKIAAAVSAVKNKVITYQGKPIDALFFAVSTGETESSANVWGGSQPYLVPVASTWDTTSSDYSSSVSVKQSDFKAKAGKSVSGAKYDKNPAEWLVVTKRSASGIVLEAQLCGVSLSGDRVKSLFGLKSADFEVSFKSGVFTFAVKGDGHDVGMSQYGAEYLAAHGKNWEEIVKHYYTGVAVSDYIW